jgi:hypothetical protein
VLPTTCKPAVVPPLLLLLDEPLLDEPPPVPLDELARLVLPVELAPPAPPAPLVPLTDPEVSGAPPLPVVFVEELDIFTEPQPAARANDDPAIRAT